MNAQDRLRAHKLGLRGGPFPNMAERHAPFIRVASPAASCLTGSAIPARDYRGATARIWTTSTLRSYP